MISKLTRNRASAVKTKFDLQVMSLSIPAVPKMKEISKGDIVNLCLERHGKLITQTEDVSATYNPRDNGITLKFNTDMLFVSTMYRDSSNKYKEKKSKIQLRVKNIDTGKYHVVGDAEVLLDELATIYDTTMETIATKSFKIKNASVPGIVLKLKFTVSSIGTDEVHNCAYETDSVISDATMDTSFEEIDLKQPSLRSLGSTNSMQSNHSTSSGSSGTSTTSSTGNTVNNAIISNSSSGNNNSNSSNNNCDLENILEPSSDGLSQVSIACMLSPELTIPLLHI